MEVTKLMLEGIVVACKWDHWIGDAYSFGMFMAAWAEVSRTNSLTLVPNFRHSLLSPRHPGSYARQHVRAHGIPEPAAQARGYFIGSIQQPDLSFEREHPEPTPRSSSTDGTTKTKLEAFSTFLWKLMANASGDAESCCRMGIVVDGRSRLKEGPRSALYGYFGNVISIPFGEATVEDLKSKLLGWAAKKVNKLLVYATNREHFQGLIDYVEGQKPNPMMTRVYYRGADDGPAIVVSHARVLDPSKMDFGWGLPFLMSGHFSWGRDARFVLLLPSPLGNGDWVVYMHLFRHQLHKIEMARWGRGNTSTSYFPIPHPSRGLGRSEIEMGEGGYFNLLLHPSTGLRRSEMEMGKGNTSTSYFPTPHPSRGLRRRKHAKDWQ
ncbi:coniferyl alcohol acyltransferase-like [Nymphaea colorata]|nr:coniferyl alcohol acyltransferase-like [Nymphaea colorata]